MREGLELGGRYRLVERIGRGGMGEVWRATDLRLDRPVAVKLLPAQADADPRLVTRFRREAQLAAGLQHPGITVVHDIDEHPPEQLLYLVMELLDGDDLGRVLARRPGGLPLDEALSLAVQISGALAAAHARGVVHRDIKPANLIVLRDGWVKICDFGIARFVESATGLTGTGMIGTPVYMAPEQFSSGEVDGRTDLYALGCLLHQLLCGRPPFPVDQGIPALINGHLNLTPPGPRAADQSIPEDVDGLVRELLAKDPADRPADAVTVTRRLQALRVAHTAAVTTDPSLASPVPLSGPPSEPVRPEASSEAVDPERPSEAVRAETPAEAVRPEAPARAAPPEPAPAAAWALPGSGAGQEALLSDPRLSDLEHQHEIAVEHCYQGRFSQALALADHVARTRMQLLGPEHPDTLSSRHLVGTALYMLDMEADAERVVYGAAEARSRVLGPHHADTLTSWHLLAKILYMLGRHAEALPIAAGVASSRQQVLGPDDADTLDTRNTVAWTLHMLGRNAEALPLAYDVAHARARVLGNEHEDTLDSRQLIGWVQHALGRFAGAHTVALELRDTCLRLFGPTAEQTLQAHGLLEASAPGAARRR
ncbi:protein kinase domain-containing protein [Actinomadura scrupuli]|uniref:serine/threonine-protein kinase n=1 Tax=Actinomadura scrupuli TaxID=559629 RepID=UPI003D987922